MPRIHLREPYGMSYQITTRQTETVLKAWFDEVLPHTFLTGRPGIDDFEYLWPWIDVFPMPAWGANPDMDWLTDSRVLGRWHEFQARDGEEGLKMLLELRRQLEAELRSKRI